MFDAIAEALEIGRPGGACAMAIAGAPSSGLRTLRMAAARAARLQGYVPITATALQAHAWVVDGLMGRHVCVLDHLYGAGPAAGPANTGAGGTPTALRRDLVALLTRLAVVSPRRHVVLSFDRGTSVSGVPPVRMDPMGITAMTGMVFVDPALGPTPRQLFEAARRADGHPGQFLAHLDTHAPDRARSAPMAVHETTQPYVVDAGHPTGGSLSRRDLGVLRIPDGRTARLLRRATGRGEALARAGRHASAGRVLTRAARVLAARGEHEDAARCSLRLGWLAIDRGRTAGAVRAFEASRTASINAGIGISATIGLGTAWIEDGRLVEAEAALRSACLAATGLGEPGVAAHAAAALGRCLYWQGRYDEAAAAVRTASTESGAPAALALLTAARVHIADGTIPAAVRAARQAVDVASRAADPRVMADAWRVLAAAVASAGDPESAMLHISDGLRVAKTAHLPLAAARLRLARADIEGAEADSPAARALAVRLVAASTRWPRLLRFQARAVAARTEGRGLDAPTRAFVEASGAIALARPCGSTASNPVADLELFLRIGQTASDDPTAIDRVAGELRERLRAASVLIVGAPPERRVLAVSGRPWHGDPQIAWRALGSGAGIPADSALEPCQAAEPLRYGGEVIGAIAARWTAGAMLDAARAAALLRVAALAVAANVRAVLDRAVPQPAEPAWTDLIGESAPARSLRESIARAARAPFPVLIEGESGSGKELVARAIHRLGARRDRRFCAINCAALSDDLLEAELFGHVRGAYTGAVSDRPGLFEEADGGTLFLDEIGELSARAQAKLLRVLQDGEVRRVGENASRRVDVRIVAATNRRLVQEAAAGRFRSDLRFRLDVVRIDVPPLRDRASDVPLLAARFWNDAAARVGSRATLSPDAAAALARYEWPGNVRELQNVIAWMAVQGPRRGRVGSSSLPAHLALASTPPGGTFEAARAEFERRFVKAALATADGQRAKAAEALGMTRQGLAKMLRRLGLE
ncbi:MAG: sigma 54-interacting transcriptional regulator [Acidobacteriota bacterium]